MDKEYIREQLSWLDPDRVRTAQGRRLKVYVQQLDMNFHLVNPGRGALSVALRHSLARTGIMMGWKADATVWPREVDVVELRLMLMTQGHRRRSR